MTTKNKIQRLRQLHNNLAKMLCSRMFAAENAKFSLWTLKFIKARDFPCFKRKLILRNFEQRKTCFLVQSLTKQNLCPNNKGESPLHFGI